MVNTKSWVRTALVSCFLMPVVSVMVIFIYVLVVVYTNRACDAVVWDYPATFDCCGKILPKLAACGFRHCDVDDVVNIWWIPCFSTVIRW